MAKAHATETAVKATGTGPSSTAASGTRGIGLHVLLKRALLNQALFGTPAQHRPRLAHALMTWPPLSRPFARQHGAEAMAFRGWFISVDDHLIEPAHGSSGSGSRMPARTSPPYIVRDGDAEHWVYEDRQIVSHRPQRQRRSARPGGVLARTHHL